VSLCSLTAIRSALGVDASSPRLPELRVERPARPAEWSFASFSLRARNVRLGRETRTIHEWLMDHEHSAVYMAMAPNWFRDLWRE
jgi:hypothetical protein